MDDNGNRENGRHKPDHYRTVHAQWMMPQQHQMKDHHHTAQTIKLMAVIAERDAFLHERDLALSEKKTALTERDMAIFQRDTAIAERNNAIIERDNAIAALNHYNNGARTINHQHHHQQQNQIPHSSSLESSGSPYDTSEAFLTSTQSERWPKKEPKPETVASPNKPSKSRKSKRGGGDNNLNRQVTIAEMNGEWRIQEINEDDCPHLKSQGSVAKKHRKEWKIEDLGGLNEVTYDETSMPVPVCSCTGKSQPCYKWGNGGWQSACCTTTLSMYPLPVMPNKRHARVNGRKMSGSVFNKLLSRLASEGHDLRVPLDLKDHWSKHGTNRYITIK